MRKIKFILLFILPLCGLLLGSCTTDISDVGYGDTQIELELSTFAVNGSSDVNAHEEEKVIKSAYVFIFNSAGVLENSGKTAVTTATVTGEVIDATKKLNAKWNVYEGNKDIYIVANPDTELAGRLVTMSAINGLEKSVLEALITAESAFATDVAAFSTKGMMMAGKVSATAISGSSTTVPVTVTRRHARIDFMLRKAKDLEGVTVVVKSVKYKDQKRRTIVFPSTPTAATVQEESKTTTTTIAAQQAVAGQWSGTATDYTPITDFYTFERAAGTTAACLEMTVSIDGTDKLLPVYICSTAQGANNTGNDEDRPIAIEANKVYKVMGTLTRRSIDIALDILDWNDQDVNGDIYGADFTVSKSQIIMDWWAFGESFSTSLNLTASENINFVGYEHNGTTTTDGSNLPAWLPLANITGLPAVVGTSNTATVGLTYVPDGTYPKYSVYLWLKAGNIKKRIEIVYDNGYLPKAVLETKNWLNFSGDGIHISKKGNVNPSEPVGDVANEKCNWSDNDKDIPFGATDSPDGSQYGMGPLLTNQAISILGEGAYAAQKARSLGAEWYLPSADELGAVCIACYYLGPSYTVIGNDYFSSTQYKSYPANIWHCWVANGGGSALLWTLKTEPSGKSNARAITNIHEKLKFPSAVVAADWYAWGESFTTAVDYVSTDGAVSVQSVDNSGATKDWLTSAVISGGKLQLTYTPTAGNDGVHDYVKVTLATENGYTNSIYVQYDNGFIPSTVLPTEWVLNRPVNGIQITKRGNLLPPDAAAGSELSLRLSGQRVLVAGAQNAGYGYGVANTDAQIAQLGADAVPGTAIRAIGAEWYLPSNDEMVAIATLMPYLGQSYNAGTGTYASVGLGTSTERDADYGYRVNYSVSTGVANLYPTYKPQSVQVRGVRNY